MPRCRVKVRVLRQIAGLTTFFCLGGLAAAQSTTVFPTDSAPDTTQGGRGDLVSDGDARAVAAARANTGGTVTPSGAFTYSIPIELPPGSGKLQPSLAL